LLVAD
jgi:hypothetical protein